MTPDKPRGLCGTMLLYADTIQLWDGHESKAAMHQAQGTTPPRRQLDGLEENEESLRDAERFYPGAPGPRLLDAPRLEPVAARGRPSRLWEWFSKG